MSQGTLLVAQVGSVCEESKPGGMPKADVRMPSWMDLLEPLGPTPSAR